jgi:hypothetical protein
VSDEQSRLDYYVACQAEAAAAVPAAPPQVQVPDHSAEILSAHQGTALADQFSVAQEAQA